MGMASLIVWGSQTLARCEGLASPDTSFAAVVKTSENKTDPGILKSISKSSISTKFEKQAVFNDSRAEDLPSCVKWGDKKADTKLIYTIFV